MLFLDLIVLKIKGDFCDFFRLLFQQILDKLPLGGKAHHSPLRQKGSLYLCSSHQVWQTPRMAEPRSG